MGKSLLVSTTNTRELGGWPTRTGGLTRRDRIWRSDAPVVPNEADAETLRGKGIRTIIDLRTEAEARRKPCALAGAEGFRYRPFPITEGSEPPATLAEVPAVYLRIALQPALAQALRTAAEAEGGVLICCTAGKDRTGVLSALILLACGAEPRAIVADYVLSREYNRERLEAYLAAHPETDRRVVLASEGSMEGFLALFAERCGSVPACFESIGLTAAQLRALRGKLLD